MRHRFRRMMKWAADALIGISLLLAFLVAAYLVLRAFPLLSGGEG